MNRLFLIILFYVGLSQDVFCDERNDFGLLFDFPVIFSGNFAELRSNHFHGGLDFKTEGVVGKPIHAPADGYVSRVTVSPGGYGNAMYITHYNGYTTVYGHLEKFLPDIEKIVRANQYKNESFAVDISFDKNKFVFKRGEVIAYSGNSGYSFGPHLHFEIRKTDSNEFINPLVYYKSYVSDTKAPVAFAVSLYSRLGKGVVDGRDGKSIRKIIERTVKDTVRVWGDVGFGVKALDFMDGTSNHYGIYRMELLVDDSLLFAVSADSFSANENRLINAWTDYEAHYFDGEWFMRFHLLDNNPLKMLSADKNRGWLRVDEERIYNVEYVLADMHGNVSRYNFAVKGERCDIPEFDYGNSHCLHWDVDNELRDLGLILKISKGELFEDAILDVKRVEKNDAVSDRYYLNGIKYPLRNKCELSLRIKYVPSCGTDKCYIRYVRNNGGYGVGGVYENGWMKTTVSLLGCYEIAVDTIPPKVKEHDEKNWTKNGIVAFYLRDNETGIKTYKGYIDGEFKLFEYSSKNARLTCDLKAENVKKGKHRLRLVVTDGVGNETIIEKNIKY